MFVQNVIKLNAAVRELSCLQKNTEMVLKTILPSLPRAIKTRTKNPAVVSIANLTGCQWPSRSSIKVD